MPRYVVKDTFYKKAKKEGYRARSAYKLEEVQQKFRIIRPRDKILDLGAAPGGWLQVESTLAGKEGLVVGIDILPVAPLQLANVVFRKEDIRELRVADFLAELAIPSFDVITSDIAPNLSGIKDVDYANIMDLYQAVLRVVKEGLRQGGNFLIKVFVSPEFKSMTVDLQPLFARVTAFKPKASRDVSAETYLVCMGKR
jgi:23S rRNA (uridine2552-2'-O)-methyltransferase